MKTVVTAIASIINTGMAVLILILVLLLSHSVITNQESIRTNRELLEQVIKLEKQQMEYMEYSRENNRLLRQHLK